MALDSAADTPGRIDLAVVLDAPKELTIDPGGDVLIVDTENHAIRRCGIKTGIVDTIAGGRTGSNGGGGPARPAWLAARTASPSAPTAPSSISATPGNPASRS